MSLRIRNWEQFQVYKSGPRSEGRMHWIKLHLSLLDDRHWHATTGDDAKVLIMLFLLAGEDSGSLPEVSDIAFRFRMDEKKLSASLARLSGWLLADGEQPVNSLLTDCYQPATLDKKRVEKKKAEYSDDFERLWSTHRRGSKPKAWDEYQQAVSDGVTLDVMLPALEAYVETLRDDFHGQHLERWIRDERWLEFSEAPAKPKAYKSGEVAEW
jgi:hypothetical protein